MIKKIKLCAKMRIKNIYTSSNLYKVDKLPIEMQMLLSKNEKYLDKYQYLLYMKNN